MKHDDLVGDAQYYADLAARARAQYDSVYAANYRHEDEKGIDYITHLDQAELLEEVSASFGRPIDVLDLACGTGRYWHHLRNLKSLTGVDISPDMLKLAEHPVREDAITAPIKLLCANLAEVVFPDNTFDLVYAIGVLGRFMPLDGYMVAKVWRMLKPEGQFVVTTMDRQSPHGTSWKRRAAQAVLPWLPLPLKRRVRERLRDFALTKEELAGLMATSQWGAVRITRRSVDAGATEWVCLANKD